MKQQTTWGGASLRLGSLALLLAVLGARPAVAVDKPASPAAKPAGAAAATAGQPAAPSPIALAGAYQDGYLQVVSAACYELYNSLGIIATDLSQGHINGATAVSALDKNALLLGACSTTLEDVRSLTPAEDAQAQDILGRLTGLLDALGTLHSALEDAATTPTRDKKALDAAAAAVNAARAKVEAALEEYAKPL